MASSRHQSVRWVYAPDAAEKSAGTALALDPLKWKHLRTVLRLSDGDEVRAIDGAGRGFSAIIKSDGNKGSLELKELLEERTQGRVLELIVGFPKNKTMDWIVEKAVECGVGVIRPIVTSRSVVVPHKDEVSKYARRWEAIAAEALEQSQQLWMPVIHAPQPWESLLTQHPGRAFVFCSESREQGGLAQSLLALKAPSEGPLRLFIGPEGGFSTEERRQLAGVGYQELSLGAGILRVETAAVMVLTLGRICLSD